MNGYDTLLQYVLDQSLREHLATRGDMIHDLLSKMSKSDADHLLVTNLVKSLNKLDFKSRSRAGLRYTNFSHFQTEHYNALLAAHKHKKVSEDYLSLWFWSRNFDELVHHYAALDNIPRYSKI